MIALLLAMVAWAQAAWVPLGELEPQDEGLHAGQIWLEQGSRQRVLFTVYPADAPLWIESEGAWQPLAAGPDGSLLLPAPTLTRELRIHAPEHAVITAWRESLTPVQVAWDRYEEALARWVLHGGTLPTPPQELYELEDEWVLRRQAFLAVGEPVHEALLASMLLDLESRRALSGRDHPALILQTGDLADGQEFTQQVQGPGVLVLDVQAQLQADPYLDFRLIGTLDGRPELQRQTAAGENPETPGLSWSRRLEVVVPPGLHTVGLTLEGADGKVTPVWRARRGGWRRAGLMRRFADGGRPRGDLERLERDVILRDPTVAMQAHALLAQENVHPAVERLALLRLVRWSRDDAEAVAIVREHPQDTLLLAALARRWQAGAPVDPQIFVEDPRALPLDPQLLAELAVALGGPFFRPRGEAILRLAGGDLRGWDGSRWSALEPVEGGTLIRAVDSPGVPRVVASPGEVVLLELPEVDAGQVPVLRLMGEAPVRYRVDGREAYGAGRLDEALSSGQHTVEVLEGQLWILDAHLVVQGGLRTYERTQAQLPASFLLPDPGAPVALALLADSPGTVRIELDDGDAFEVELPPEAERVVVPVGPWAQKAVVHGPEHMHISVLMRHPKGELLWPTLPDPGIDPVAMLGQASRTLVLALQEGADDAQIAALRLQRAGAYQALGLTGSARAEANLVLQLEGATDDQRRAALAALPPAPPVRSPGPQSAEAVLALRQMLPPSDAAGWQAAAETTTPQSYAALVWERAAQAWLDEGDPVRAYHCAEMAGPRADGLRRRAATSGEWVALNVLDQSGGVVKRTVHRRPPDDSDGALSQAREAALGSPWPGDQAAVLRPGRQDVLEFSGSRMDLSLLCRDESFSPEPQPCALQVGVDDGELQPIEVLDGQLQTLPLVLTPGEHQVVVRLDERAGPAVLVHAQTPDGPLPPTLQVSTHRVGSGVEVSVPAPVLLRVKLHEGGPVQLRVGDTLRPIEDTTVVPLLDTGTLPLRIEGPPGALVTLSVLEPQAQPEQSALAQAREEASQLSAEARLPPTPTGPVAQATTTWMQEVAFRRPPVQSPMGGQASLWAGGRLGVDLAAEADALDTWRYAQLGAGFRRRGPRTDRYSHAAGYGRASLDGPPAAGLELEQHWLPQRWVLSAELSAWHSLSAGHISGRLRARYLFELSPRWRVQPWLWMRAGVWSPEGSNVDPRAWTTYGRDHWLGAGLGTHVDFKPYRDLRFRATPALYTNVNGTLDKAGATLRADWLLNPRWWLVGSAGLERRFVDLHRDEAFWRTQLQAGATYGLWRTPEQWWLFSARVLAYPNDRAVQAWVGLTVEFGSRRGVYDHVPIDAPFLAQRDLPLEQR
ncbi:MAG: hypothetical protein VX899_06825 [Myxococcota bacterium]|nr:hypothetical protein [Myxococcota bacterium]